MKFYKNPKMSYLLDTLTSIHIRDAESKPGAAAETG